MKVTSENIKSISIEDLAAIRQGLQLDHPDAILIDNEIHRRQDQEAILATREANSLAREANSVSRDALKEAREANSLSRDANSIAISARRDARRANKIATIAAIIAALSMIISIFIAVFK